MAATYGISKTSVQRLLKEHGVTLRHQGLSPDQLRHAAHLYQAGKSVAQVARALSLSPSSVYDALTRAGTAMRHSR
jgi:transposase-like protein